MNFIEELTWRGLIHNVTPETENFLKTPNRTAYVGVDPTANSLHIGHLAGIMMLKLFQMSGHKPIILVGGATGMIGDPSGKKEERQLLSEEIITNNIEAITRQFAKILHFDNSPNSAILVNNYDWMKGQSFLDFIRDVGKHISISYMLSKDSVKTRLEAGLSFTEFSYQLVQANDFLHLYENYNCQMQMGGSDQWGNITTGVELIRRKTGGDTYALTCPLVTKADGGKFGKTESGNIWLDPNLTSPYKFYQFWLNSSDEDVAKFIRIFTLFSKEEVEAMEAEHMQAPHLRLMQKTIAKDLTTRIHSEEDYLKAVSVSDVLFGNGTFEAFNNFTDKEIEEIFEGVPRYDIPENELIGNNIINILSGETTTNILASKGEARRALKENSISVNKKKVNDTYTISSSDLINNKYILIQKGKKNYYLLKVMCS